MSLLTMEEEVKFIMQLKSDLFSSHLQKPALVKLFLLSC